MFKLQERRTRAMPVFEGSKDLIVFEVILAYFVVIGFFDRSADEERIRGV
jgi:hypothetical protein